MKKLNATKISETKITSILTSETSKSQKIKLLFDSGLTVKEISERLQIRYNFAYNVISNYININDIETETEAKVSKKDEILSLFSEGKSNKEISKLLKTNYNYVCKVLKEQLVVTTK